MCTADGHIFILMLCLYLTFRSREIAFEAQTSRYLNEFEELAILGKGGYGRVYKVCFYFLFFIFLLLAYFNLLCGKLCILRSNFHYYD